MKKREKTLQFAGPLAISSIICSAIAPKAHATPYHITVPSVYAKKATNCTFPDGTASARSETYCYTPKEFLSAYGIDKLHAAGITGKGQTIILADSFGSPTLQRDLDHFSDTFGLPRTTIEFVYPNGPYTNDMADDDKKGWAEETTLDLEWAHAIAPDAKLVNIVSNSSETVGLAGLPDLFKGIQMAVKQYPGSIISMSFGTGEPTFTPSDIKNFLKGSFHQTLKKASDAGVTLLASSGDSGSTNLDAAQKELIPTPNVSYPASDSYITAVGGTSLQVGWKWNPQGTLDDYWKCKLSAATSCPSDIMSSISTNATTETVWNEGWAFAAGGGGVSTIYGAPAYQMNVNASAKKIMGGRRGLPDVSMNAAIDGGVDIYTSFANQPKWQSTGGTSCAAPEMAALIALAGQKASEISGKPVSIGYLNPILYSLSPSVFNDIVSQKMGTQGQIDVDNNALYFSADAHAKYVKSVPPVAVPGYFTTDGFDLATGLGSPKAESFVLGIASARAAQVGAPSPQK